MTKVVVLLSDKRSGSTMLQTELCKHRHIQHVDYSPHTYFETHHWLKAAVLLGQPEQLYHGSSVYKGYGSRANARTYLLDCVSTNVPDFCPPKTDRELVFAGWDALCERYCQPVFFEKSPQVLAHWASLSLLLEWMSSTTHEVKLVGLTRNPMAVMHSAEKLFHTAPNERQYGWLDIQKNMLAVASMVPAGSFHHIRYEDMVRSPEATFGALQQFIGVEVDPQVGQGVYTSSEQAWKDNPHFTVHLHASVRQMARSFGYSDDELGCSPAAPEQPRTGRRLSSLASVTASAGRLNDRLIKPLKLKLKRR